MQLEFCYKNIAHNALSARSLFTDKVESTADSFKSWDTCMDNKTCKIVAIVGIVLAALVLFWIISTVIRCLCLGFTCVEALFCCCGGRRRQRYEEPQRNAYDNGNMYPRQPVPMAQPSYQPVNVYAAPAPVDRLSEESYRHTQTGYKV